MTYPWAIVIAGLAIAIGVANMKLVPDPPNPETVCYQQHGRWVYRESGSSFWTRLYGFTCEYKESRKE